MTYKLLIVDDELPNLRLLERLFRPDYQCLTASSGAEAIKLLDQHDIAVIITDQRMPEMTGIELLKSSADRRPHMVRILLTGYTDIETLVEAVNCGLVYMYVSKPWKNDDLKLRITRAVEHYEQNKRRHSLVAANDRLENRLKELKLGFIRAMAATVKLKDEYLFSHGARTGKCAALLATETGLSESIIVQLTTAAYLHDLGAIGMRNSNASGASRADIPVIGNGAEYAAQILACIPEMDEVADIIRFCGENYDGSGFPLGLSGEQIPMASRIMRLASEYDSITNPRNTSAAADHSSAIKELSRRAGHEFDPKLVEALSDLSSNHRMQLEELSAVRMRPDLITWAVN
ncbi:MAG: HD domain-containing phosphohydrolase [Pyrinomonadaceae bacterium]